MVPSHRNLQDEKGAATCRMTTGANTGLLSNWARRTRLDLADTRLGPAGARLDPADAQDKKLVLFAPNRPVSCRL